MESRKLFSDRTVRRRKPRRALPRIFAISAVAPGIGHLLVGKRRLGIGLLAGILVASSSAPVAAFFGWEHLGWLLARGAVLTALFATVDATLLGAEENDRRGWDGHDRPRLSAYLDLLTYGGGTWRRGERALAGLALGGGLFLHGLLASRNLPLLLLSELLLLGWGWLSWQRSREAVELSRVHVSTDFDELGREDTEENDEEDGEPDPRPARRRRTPPPTVDRTPAWLQPALGGFCVLVFLSAVGSHALVQNVQESLRIERDRAVAMEPFYRNPDYGIALEMNAPGWSFVDPADNEFVVARHVSQDATLRLKVQPRIPLVSGDRAAAIAAVAEAAMEGMRLEVLDERPVEVGGRSGHYLRARGQRGTDPLTLELWTTGRGWREYVLWFERDPSHEAFARAEVDFLLDHLSIENGRPELLQPSTAR